MARSLESSQTDLSEQLELGLNEPKSDTIDEATRLLWKELKSRARSASSLKNIANAVFVLSVSFICIQQCYIQVDEYLKYKENIQLSHEITSSAFWMIPGITICNNNRVRLDNIADKLPELVFILNKVINQTEEENLMLLPKRRRFEIMKQIKEVLSSRMNLTDLILNSPLAELMKLSTSSLIKDVNCNAPWGTEVNCENFRIIESYQSGPCYTLFYLGAELEALANGQAYDFNTSLLRGQRKINNFDSHELVEIFIDFDPSQVVDFKRDIGGKLIIHSSGHIGSIVDLSHAILPGNSYNVIIQREFIKRLPPPYSSQCFEYKKANMHKFTNLKDYKASVEFDKTTCVRNCVIRRMTRTCNCWPIEIPFFPDDTIVNDTNTFKMCPWGSEETSTILSTTYFIDCYKTNLEECRKECRPACLTEDYKVHVIAKPWPTRDMFFLAKNEEERIVLKRLEACCTKISIRYLEFLESRHIMYPSMTFVQLVSNIGGIVSAFVGVSTLTIYHFITRKIIRCKVVNDSTITSIKKRIRKRALIGARLCKQVATVSPVNQQQ